VSAPGYLMIMCLCCLLSRERFAASGVDKVDHSSIRSTKTSTEQQANEHIKNFKQRLHKYNVFTDTDQQCSWVLLGKHLGWCRPEASYDYNCFQLAARYHPCPLHCWFTVTCNELSAASQFAHGAWMVVWPGLPCRRLADILRQSFLQLNSRSDVSLSFGRTLLKLVVQAHNPHHEERAHYKERNNRPLRHHIVATGATSSQKPRSMGLMGVARANTAVGASPVTFLLLLLQSPGHSGCVGQRCTALVEVCAMVSVVDEMHLLVSCTAIAWQGGSTD
jgi:hypothetical protein